MSEPTFDLPELSENLVTIIAPLGDEPNVDDGLSAQQLRNKFDEGGKNIRNFLNNTLSPAIRTFLRSLNTSITNLSGTLTSDYRTASAQDEIDGAITEDIDDITDDMATADMLGIVINGNSTPVGASAGQYVIVKDSTISGITDGLYTAAQAIPANTAIDSTYLTAVSVGGLNDITVYTPLTTLFDDTHRQIYYLTYPALKLLFVFVQSDGQAYTASDFINLEATLPSSIVPIKSTSSLTRKLGFVTVASTRAITFKLLKDQVWDQGYVVVPYL